jgi:hypothetical protein
MSMKKSIEANTKLNMNMNIQVKVNMSMKLETKMNVKRTMNMNMKIKMNENLNEYEFGHECHDACEEECGLLTRRWDALGAPDMRQLKWGTPDIVVVWRQSDYQVCGYAQVHIW